MYLCPTMIKLHFVAFACLLGTSACTDPNAPSKRLAQIAAGYCECAGPLAELDQKARSAAADTTGALTSVLEQMQAAFDQANECLRPLLGEQGTLKPAEKTAILPLLQKQCPSLATNQELINELLCK